MGIVLYKQKNSLHTLYRRNYAGDPKMAIKERFFQVGEEWNVIFLPSKPNGFAVFVIGDVNHFVKKNTSSWHQRPDQAMYIERLKDAGYTVISSNLLGRNWGSEEACFFFKRLYDEVMKKEILNKKAHVIAEGMGALVAAKVIPSMEGSFRSTVMINPCLSLKDYFEQEKSSKFFYKRITKELKQAYNFQDEELETSVATMNIENLKGMSIPTKIFHCMNATPYSLQSHVRPYEQMCNEDHRFVEVSIFLRTKAFQDLALPTIDFFNKNEKFL